TNPPVAMLQHRLLPTNSNNKINKAPFNPPRLQRNQLPRLQHNQQPRLALRLRHDSPISDVGLHAPRLTILSSTSRIPQHPRLRILTQT
ncbi:MAG: hypothetical protein KGQ60_07315, partial [Planctomycetes bacterium]|nr:hypothetical protein [Planctomycetota bacterium]